MKKLTFVFVALLLCLAFFISCDENNMPDTSALSGKDVSVAVSKNDGFETDGSSENTETYDESLMVSKENTVTDETSAFDASDDLSYYVSESIDSTDISKDEPTDISSEESMGSPTEYPVVYDIEVGFTVVYGDDPVPPYQFAIKAARFYPEGKPVSFDLYFGRLKGTKPLPDCMGAILKLEFENETRIYSKRISASNIASDEYEFTSTFLGETEMGTWMYENEYAHCETIEISNGLFCDENGIIFISIEEEYSYDIGTFLGGMARFSYEKTEDGINLEFYR